MAIRYFSILFFFTLAELSLSAEVGDSIKAISQTKTYTFIIQDAPARLFTMRQFDQDYLSSYRLWSSMMQKSFRPLVNYSIQSVSFIFLLGSLTHEEAHRSILVAKNIGSISLPFFLSSRDGYVEGVTDQTLKNLRDNDFPNYARLYSSGLESDYMLTHKEESLMAFNDETFKNIAVDYLMRKALLMQYYLIIFIHYDIDGSEEKNELKRDIVGNDVYGIARHFYRPTMEFKRYTQYNELTSEEKNYLRKLGYRSLFNLVNLNLIGIQNIQLTNSVKANFGMGHTLSPFGDFTDENIWLLIKNKFKIHGYLREFQNRNKWFIAGGAGISDYTIFSKFAISLTGHLWNQPENLNFNNLKGKPGAAVEFLCKYFIPVNHFNSLRRVSFNLGLIYKTQGFLPEEYYLHKHFGFNIGTSFEIDK